MNNYFYNNIKLVRGDTYACSFDINGLEQLIDTAYFTCRDCQNDNSEVLFEKSLEDGISLVEHDEEKDIYYYVVRLAPEDTKDLQAGTYDYDLEIGVNGDIFTIMKGKFVLEQDVSRH